MDGLRLEYERKRKGKSIEELCDFVGFGKSTYHRKKAGKSAFTVQEMNAIVEFLELDSPEGIFF